MPDDEGKILTKFNKIESVVARKKDEYEKIKSAMATIAEFINNPEKSDPEKANSCLSDIGFKLRKFHLAYIDCILFDPETAEDEVAEGQQGELVPDSGGKKCKDDPNVGYSG